MLVMKQVTNCAIHHIISAFKRNKKEKQVVPRDDLLFFLCTEI